MNMPGRRDPPRAAMGALCRGCRITMGPLGRIGTMSSGCAISLDSDWMIKCASERDVEERGLDYIKINGVEDRV